MILAGLPLLLQGASPLPASHAGRSCARRAQPAKRKPIPACTQEPLWCSIWPHHSTCMRNTSNSQPSGGQPLPSKQQCCMSQPGFEGSPEC